MESEFRLKKYLYDRFRQGLFKQTLIGIGSVGFEQSCFQECCDGWFLSLIRTQVAARCDPEALRAQVQDPAGEVRLLWTGQHQDLRRRSTGQHRLAPCCQVSLA